MIKILQTSIKEKERKILDIGQQASNLHDVDWDKYIPKDAKNIEISYKKNTEGVYLLSIDYIKKAETIKE